MECDHEIDNNNQGTPIVVVSVEDLNEIKKEISTIKADQQAFQAAMSGEISYMKNILEDIHNQMSLLPKRTSS